jgi:TatD DNase family protein
MTAHRTCLVDTHCHLDLYPDPPALLSRIEETGIHTVAVTNAPSVFAHTLRLVAKSRFVRAAVGLHPELVNTHGQERPLLWHHLEDTRFVGEVGLDYVTTDEGERALQRKVFREVLDRCAEAADKVLTVHSRRSASDVIDMVGAGFPGAVILHWFSGTLKEAARATTNRCYFSVNPAMVKSRSGQALIQQLNPDFVLTETDGPFVVLGKEPARPHDVSIVIRHLAGVWGCEEETAQERVFANFQRLIGQEWAVIH